jgi:hypothetical protein
MLNRIAHDPHTHGHVDANGEADLRAAHRPLAVDDRLMEAVDSYIPTPDVTTPNPPPGSGS